MAHGVAQVEAMMRIEQQTVFDQWLHVMLTREFGTAASEELPHELLSLLPGSDDVGAEEGR